MHMRISRRTLLALAGVGALNAGVLGSVAARAQAPTSPYTFPDGTELTWMDPWSMYEENFVTSILPNSASLQGGNRGELVVGYYDAATSIGDATTAFLTFMVQDPALAPNVAGGGGQSVGPGGVVEAQTDYRVHSFMLDNEDFGFYIQLIDELQVTVFIAPVAAFAAELATAQASVQLGGEPVLAEVDGASIQQELEGAIARAAGTASDAATPATEGGEYTDAAGLVHVTWTNGWTVVSQNEGGIELTNPAHSIVVSTQGVAFDGRTWQQATDDTVAYLADDQGSNATVSGPMVTDSGFSFATEGDYGLRLAQGTPSEDPGVFVLVFAANIDGNGAAAVALLEEARAAILVNGNPPLTGLESFIDMSAG